MPIPRRVAARLTTIATLASAATALIGALAMGDRARLVDILALFFGGAGAGAGVASMLVQRRLAARASADAQPPLAGQGAPHTPPTVPWREPR